MRAAVGRGAALAVCTIGLAVFPVISAFAQTDPFEPMPAPPVNSSAAPNGPQPSPSPATVRIPLGHEPPEDAVKIESHGDRLSMVVRNAPLADVLSLLGGQRHLNIVFDVPKETRISITLNDAPWEDALTAIVSVAGYHWSSDRGIIYVTRVDQKNVPARLQGRVLRVFTLDYAAAADMQETVEGFLSPLGKAHVQASSPDDNRRTRETLVVEDVPEVVERVEQYIAQVDRPPRQVLIQVHVLQVELKDDLAHGVNLDAVLRIAHEPIRFETVGMANDGAGTATFISLKGADLSTLIQLLQTTTDAKTIASPKVLCLNGQQSRIQVGEQLGFRVTTTTQTGTFESVEFLDVGVVLKVTPRISRDNRVVMDVQPKVSSGKVNPLTGLPEEETTEAETSVMLHDGEAIVIGGLIQEFDNDTQSKVPKLGDHWRLGKFFQHRQAVKERSEIIIALVPYVLPYDECNLRKDCTEVTRAATPLLYGPLQRVPRPWEPRLPNAYDSLARLPDVKGYPAGEPIRPAQIPPVHPYEYPVPESAAGTPMEEIPPGAPVESAPPAAQSGRLPLFGRLRNRLSRRPGGNQR